MSEKSIIFASANKNNTDAAVSAKQLKNKKMYNEFFFNTVSNIIAGRCDWKLSEIQQVVISYIDGAFKAFKVTSVFDAADMICKDFGLGAWA